MRSYCLTGVEFQLYKERVTGVDCGDAADVDVFNTSELYTLTWLKR